EGVSWDSCCAPGCVVVSGSRLAGRRCTVRVWTVHQLRPRMRLAGAAARPACSIDTRQTPHKRVTTQHFCVVLRKSTVACRLRGIGVYPRVPLTCMKLRQKILLLAVAPLAVAMLGIALA